MMGLKDIVSGANLGIWATIALVMFVALFAAIGVWTLSRPRDQIEKWRRSPLSDD